MNAREPVVVVRAPLAALAALAALSVASGLRADTLTGASHTIIGSSFSSGTVIELLGTAPVPSIGRAAGSLGDAITPEFSEGGSGTGAFAGFWPIAGPAPICGDGLSEPPEECDDGATVDGEGCSASCRIEDETRLYGLALGGFNVSVQVDGVPIQIVTGAGQTPAQVAAALAASINANPTLQAQGITALAIGNRLVTTGTLTNLVIDDPGLASAPPEVPALSLVGVGLLAALLAGTAARHLPPARRRIRSS